LFFQVAKVSKLLLLMEKGKGHKYRGKSLDEIDIQLDSLISDEESDTIDNEDNDDKFFANLDNQKNTTLNEKNTELIQSINLSNEKISPKKKVTIVPWTEKEKRITLTFFKKHIIIGKAPNKQECEHLMQLHSQAINKPWKKIKDFVYNTIKYNKKKIQN